MIGLIATKEGMTRVFHENGESIPVSVIKVDPNIVSQIKNEETDGYSAVQLSSDDRKEKNVIKPNKGHFSKNNINTKNNLYSLLHPMLLFNIYPIFILFPIFSSRILWELKPWVW